MSLSRKFEIHDELIVQPWKNGVRLMHPTSSNKHLNNSHTLGNIKKFPCNVFFEIGTQVAYSNELNAATCSNFSVKEITGKDIFDFSSREFAHRIMLNNKAIMESHNNLIIEESMDRNDGVLIQTVSLKYPSYDIDGNLKGVFGFAIVIGSQPLAESLSLIKSLGLLYKNNPNLSLDPLDIYLSSRELDCLRLIVRGKTAKEISNILGISKRTVESYQENIKHKMNVYSKSELIDKAYDFFLRTAI